MSSTMSSSSMTTAATASASTAKAAASAITGGTIASLIPSTEFDPDSILDDIDNYRPKAAAIGADHAKSNDDGRLPAAAGTSTAATTTATFDPIEFLNQYYTTESALVAHLPRLRQSVQDRITALDDSISNAIQRQAERGDKTSQDVARAKASIRTLHQRIQLIQSKAATSEETVLEITRDMKRLDCAKRHLQQTITALKRLHMLLYAVDQLVDCVSDRPVPKFQEAAHLIDATRLLLRHFEGYQSIPQVTNIFHMVSTQRKRLEEYIFHAFRLGTIEHPSSKVSSSASTPLVLQEGGGEDISTSTHSNKPLSPLEARELALSGVVLPENQHQDSKQVQQKSDSNEDESEEEDEEEEEEEEEFTLPDTPLDSTSLSYACMAIDALGHDIRNTLIRDFCSDQLDPYQIIFKPKQQPKSKRSTSSITTSSSTTTKEEDPTSLDQVDRRFAWYRRLLRSVEEAFDNVFPPHWKVQYQLTTTFLTQTSDHLLALLQGKDKDCENVTILLKSLQKSMIFEKEMMAWLQREHNIVFISNTAKGPGKNSTKQFNVGQQREDEEQLEFDESGKAVAADSAEGIKVRYTRQMKKERNKKAIEGESTNSKPESFLDQKSQVTEPVPTLLGMASGAFDNFMGPYIALEREQLDEQITQAASDLSVDTRGELPVFVSSTNIFLYIKNSITRCTVLTRGRTFFLLYKAFCDKLRKYSSVLSNKYPAPSSAAATAVMSLVPPSTSSSLLSSATNYKISPGEEIVICHVINTCEYCSDTIEALQDLIADKIDPQYKEQVDMTSEQDAFQDVTAKGIKILVSGLERRLDAAYREMGSINWGTMSIVGEESGYVRTMNSEIQGFTESIQKHLPQSYFRSVCDKFALAFIYGYHEALVRQKRISESGTQQLLLDVYNLKTFILKLPVDSKTVTKEFSRIEIFLKLVGTRSELLSDMFKASWPNGTMADISTIMNLKGMKRPEQQSILDNLGFSAPSSTVGSEVSGKIQLLNERGMDVAARVNSDLTQMRQKVDEFRMNLTSR